MYILQFHFGLGHIKQKIINLDFSSGGKTSLAHIFTMGNSPIQDNLQPYNFYILGIQF